jgi:hypothetical protein
MEFSFEILSLYVAPYENGLNNVVKRVTWRYTAKDGIHAADIFRDSLLESPDPNSFVVYDTLSPETVIEWIKSTENMDEVNLAALAALDKVKNPDMVEKIIPWNFESLYDRMDRYVLVHKGEVVHGPVHWHSDIMNRYLEKIGKTPFLPFDILARRQGLVPINQPTIVDEDTAFYKVNMLNEQPEGSISVFTDSDHIDWDFSSGIAVGTYNAIDKPLEEAKNNLRGYVEQIRNEKEFEGTTVTIGEETFKILTGPLSRLLLVEKLKVMQDNDTCVWKFMENKWKEVSREDVVVMLNTVDNYVQSITNWEYNIAQQIDAATSVDALREINLD